MSFPIELKLVWQEQFLGLSLNQIIDNHSIPMTSYFIWPKTDAWEQLKFELDSKPWLQEAEKVMVLNNITRLMNQWREKRSISQLTDIEMRFSATIVPD
jgi:30S ribosomal protein 3|uniref:30S ribosomal protein 3, chloroplastic n=1 Tax=uncultured prymnesiophyte C19847 TaxID=858394 RepID=D9MYK6_9EUKA|nr:hypothetical chloroplast RF65 [uncultured prymnesiophyte C19847]